MNYVEYTGYAASAFVLLSFLMRKISTLRVINMIGCSFFIVYGFMLPGVSWPIVITNTAIIIVNAYYLTKGKK